MMGTRCCCSHRRRKDLQKDGGFASIFGTGARASTCVGARVCKMSLCGYASMGTGIGVFVRMRVCARVRLGACACICERERQRKVKEARGVIARALCEPNPTPRDRRSSASPPHRAHGCEDGRAGALPALVGGAVAAQATVMTYVPSHATPSYTSQPGAWSGQRHPPAAAALLATATVEE